MIAYPHCKINLGLHIVARRPDGYHDIETIFVPIDTLRDRLEIEATEGEARMEQEGIVLDNRPDDNLCMRAWRLLNERYGIAPARMRLEKGIPFGAGLGGGSSDAAFALRMLSEMNRLGIGDDELSGLAAAIGADCAFFLADRPCYATGIGERLTPIDVDLAAYRIEIEIAEGEHVSTREAYAGVKPRGGRIDLREAVRRPIEEWRELIVNDFEESVFASHPAIARKKEEMYERGAIYASMTGSGAAVYGIFGREAGMREIDVGG